MGEDNNFFRVKTSNTVHEWRKFAIGIGQITNTPLDFYLNLPLSELQEIGEEVIEACQQLKKS